MVSSLKRVLTAVASAGALIGVLLAVVPRAGAASTSGTAPALMVSPEAIQFINGYLGENDTLTDNAFDTPSTFYLKVSPAGWVSQSVMVFHNYGTFASDVEDHTIPGSVKYFLYDNEDWGFTPPAEQEDPAYFMMRFVQLAHSIGGKAILSPATNLVNTIAGITGCKSSSLPVWVRYLTVCDVPAMVAAAQPDLYVIPAQRYENNTATWSAGQPPDCECYQGFVSQAISAYGTPPPEGFWTSLSTNYTGTASTAADLLADTQSTQSQVGGYWLNVPSNGNGYCPLCIAGGDPSVAAGYLWGLGFQGAGTQSISFSAPSSGYVGGSASLSATGGLSLNTVTFSVDPTSDPGVCELAGSTVSYMGAGNCVIDANQAGYVDPSGTTEWDPAPQVQQTIAISLLPQPIEFTTTPGSPIVGGAKYKVAVPPGITGNPVTFSIDSGSVAVCKVTKRFVSFIGVGTCTVDAYEAGNSDYSAGQASQSFAVGQGTQTISFTSVAPTAATVHGVKYKATAKATSGLPVTISVDPSSAAVCRLYKQFVSFVQAGTCTIDASQAGDSDYEAAQTISQAITVSPAAAGSPNLSGGIRAVIEHLGRYLR